MNPSPAEEWRIATAIRRATSHLNAARVELALKRLEKASRKANFNPNQPRVPAGNPDGGQWTDGGGDVGRPSLGTSDPRVLSDVTPDPDWIPGAQYAQNRPPRAQFPGATPGQNARLAAAELRQLSAIRRIREIDANWQPRTASATAPGSIEGAIAHAEARAIEAETRLRALVRQPHNRLLEAYRESNATPDLFGGGWSRERHTVAVATPEEQLFFGMNSNAPTYTGRDRTKASQTIDLMLEQFPRVINRRNIGSKPNDALYHAESTILLRMKEAFGGTLAGRTFRVTVDREMCSSCVEVLPRLGVHLGDPRVSYYDNVGLQGIMQHSRWLFLRPR
jgi:hypothetical protein